MNWWIVAGIVILCLWIGFPFGVMIQETQDISGVDKEPFSTTSRTRFILPFGRVYYADSGSSWAYRKVRYGCTSRPSQIWAWWATRTYFCQPFRLKSGSLHLIPFLGQKQKIRALGFDFQ